MSIAYELSPCPVCAERDATLVADAAALRGELESLWEFHTARLRADTPPKHLADRVAFSQPVAFRLVQCRRCTLVYRNPSERAHEVHDLYTGETPPPEVLASLHDTQRAAYRAQAARLTRIVGRAGTVVEVGSFVGGFLEAARERGWTTIGVDVNPGVNRWVRTRGHRVIDGELHDVDAPRADVVAFWNCFDQLADPPGALHAARERVHATGWVVLRVPNGDFYVRVRRLLHTRLRRAARLLLASNNLLAFPYRFGFTPGSAQRALERAGFAMERVVGDTLVPTADRWTRPWARVEERAVKAAIRALAADGMLPAPWIEIYARRRG